MKTLKMSNVAISKCSVDVLKKKKTLTGHFNGDFFKS